MIWDYGYDRADQLIRAVKHASDPQGTILQRFAYGYDPAGNRVFEQVDDTVTSWTHDRLNRLVAQQAGGRLRVAGTIDEPATVRVGSRPASLDANGLFVGGVEVAPGTTRFTVTATDGSGNTAMRSYDVDQVGAAKTFTFDANGNLTSDGTRTFEWDARNQFVAVTVGTHRTEFIYDGQQRRVCTIEKENGLVQSDTRTIWCSAAICEERNAVGAVSRRVFSGGEELGGVPRYFASDHLDSIWDVTDSTAVSVARYAFDAWGRRTVTGAGDVSRAGFTAHQWQNSSDLWLTMYRAYDPQLGRWISEDPLGIRGSLNRNDYVGNRPTRSFDPFGLQAVECRNCSKEEEEKTKNAAKRACSTVGQPSGGCRSVPAEVWCC